MRSVETRTASGLLVVEERAAYRRDEPNDNDPIESAPGTVGPDQNFGDPHGVELLPYEPAVGGPPYSFPRPQPWAGWPGEWDTAWAQRASILNDTAWACLDLNASVLAAMPPYLVGASPSLNADWINNPDPDLYASWYDFAKALWWDFQHGEAFVLATARYAGRDGTPGWPARFHVVPPWMVEVEINGGGMRRYRIGNLDVTADMLHIRYNTVQGDAHGHGPLEIGGPRIVAALALGRYATELARTGAVPNSVLKHPQKLNAKQAGDLQAAWIEARYSRLGLPAVLSGGVDFETLSFSPRDLALLELAQFNESRIAVLLGVPPPLVGLPSFGDSLTYTTAVMIREQHWQSGLKPKAAAVVQALSNWALPRGTAIEVNRDEYIRPGPLERAQTWQILIQLGVYTVEQVQEIERTTNAAPFPPLTSGVLR